MTIQSNMLYAEALIKSPTGSYFSKTQEPITSQTVSKLSYPDPQLMNLASDRLRAEGFEILHVGTVSITIVAPMDLYEQVFKVKLSHQERTVLRDNGETTIDTIICQGAETDGFIDSSQSVLAEVLEGIVLSDPLSQFATITPSPFPPPTGKWCLKVPTDVSLALNAEHAHRAGFTGRGIKVVMVDSGWYRHPFFVQHGYRCRVVLGPGAEKPEQDESGHGTGESANIFAVAPDVDFTMVKYPPANSAIGALRRAIALHPDVISCSWGWSVKTTSDFKLEHQIMAAEISRSVNQGIIVIFSAGNLVPSEGQWPLGQWAFPAQHPDVIAAGGAFMYPDGFLQASGFASGFTSHLYPGRNVPDICGLVGLPAIQEPNLGGLYIMLPVEPGDVIDKAQSGSNQLFVIGDGTIPTDGWAVFSGTSAAAPQIAGICALMKQACPQLSPTQAKKILQQTARDVTVGQGAPMSQAGGAIAKTGFDKATGAGLANATKATLMARLHHLYPLSIPPVIRSSVEALMSGETLKEEKWQELKEVVFMLTD